MPRRTARCAGGAARHRRVLPSGKDLGTPIYDGSVNASYDLDQADPLPIAAGTVHIAYKR